MNRSDIRQRILEGLNDSATSPVFWSTTQIDTIIDEAQEVLAEEIRAIRRSVHMPMVDGAAFYSSRALGDDVMSIYRIYLREDARRLTAVTLGELDARNRVWMSVEGDPWNWCPISWDLFAIYPHPATGGGFLEVSYLAWPPSLLDDSDEPEFPEADHDGLVLYGIYDGLMKQWDAAKALNIFALFMERVGKGSARSGMRKTQSRIFASSANSSFDSGAS